MEGCSLGSVCGHIEGFDSPIPTSKEICIEGLLGRHALCMYARKNTVCVCVCVQS